MPPSATALATADATISDVPACAGCAFTMTGHPAANADDRSLPATEIARGKLLAENDAIGPTGISIRRRSGRGSGLRSGIARSIRAWTQEPSSISRANIRSWLQVRARSPVRRGTPREVSALARSISASPSASMPVAMPSSSAARSAGGRARKSWNASAACSQARLICSSVASWCGAGAFASSVMAADSSGGGSVKHDHRPRHLAPVQRRVRLVDLLQRVGAGEQLVELEAALLVHPRQGRDVVARAPGAVEGAEDLALLEDHGAEGEGHFGAGWGDAEDDQLTELREHVVGLAHRRGGPDGVEGVVDAAIVGEVADG